jgi:hypothetical protein
MRSGPGFFPRLTRSPNFYGVVSGIATAPVMIAVFHLLRDDENRYVLHLQLLNCILIIPGVILSVRNRSRRGPVRYITSLFAGVVSALVAAVIFNFYLVIYLNFINPVYMQYVIRQAPLGEYMSPLIITSVFLTEEVCAGLIIALVAANLLKEGE